MFQKVFLRTTRARRFRSGMIALCAMVVIVLVAVGVSPLLALGTVTIRVDPATRAVPVNRTFTVDIVADNVDTEMNPDGLGAYEFDLVYDPSYLEVVTGGTADAGELGATGRTVTELGPNITTTIVTTMTFGAYSHPPLDANGPVSPTVVLATVTLRAKQAGVTTLNLENALLTDTQANAWPDAGAGRVLNVEGGTVTVITISADFDGDGKSDPATYQPSTGRFTISRSGSGYAWLSRWSEANAEPLIADFDGDGKADMATFNTTTGRYVIYRSGSGFNWSSTWGLSNGVPILADCDGDGATDLVSYRASNGEFVIRRSTVGYAEWLRVWGQANSEPLAADLDGDGATDLVSYRASTGEFVLRRSSVGYAEWFRTWGQANSEPLAADFDGDGKDDVATFNIASGQYIIRRSGSGFDWFRDFGQSDAEPILADLDRDGATDLITYKGALGRFIISHSSLAYGDWVAVMGEANMDDVVADFDGDGTSDLGTFNPTTGKFFVRLSDSNYSNSLVRWSTGNTVAVGY